MQASPRQSILPLCGAGAVGSFIPNKLSVLHGRTDRQLGCAKRYVVPTDGQQVIVGMRSYRWPRVPRVRENRVCPGACQRCGCGSSLSVFSKPGVVLITLPSREGFRLDGDSCISRRASAGLEPAGSAVAARHSKLESTLWYLGIDVDHALEIAEQMEL